RISDDRLQAFDIAVHARRISRHRDHTGIQAAPESRDVFEPRRIEQERALPAKVLTLESRGNAACLLVQLAVGELYFLCLTVNEKRVGNTFGSLVRARAQDFYQTRHKSFAA